MNLKYREKRFVDLNQSADADRATEEHSNSSRALLQRLGIKIPPSRAESSKRINLWECSDESLVVGNCSGDLHTGEILSLGVVTGYEGKGIGRKLLSLVVSRLRAEGLQKIWVVAPSNPALRAYGFYRALGWRRAGEQAEGDDEILELPHEAPL